jgi:hypothetical protein
MSREGVSSRSCLDGRSALGHALVLLSALLLLADGTGFGPVRLSRDVREATDASHCVEADCAGQASRPEGVVGVAVTVLGQRFEKSGPSDHSPSWRGRVKQWGWTASRLDAEVHGVIRHFGLGAWRQRNGHLSDRPLIFTISAQGPPVAA